MFPLCPPPAAPSDVHPLPVKYERSRPRPLSETVRRVAWLVSAIAGIVATAPAALQTIRPLLATLGR